MTDQPAPPYVPPYAPQPNELPSDAPAYTEPESLQQRRVAMLLMAPGNRYVLSIGSLPDHSCMIDDKTSALDVLAAIGWRLVGSWTWVSGFLTADIEPAYLPDQTRADLGEPGVEDLPDPSRYVADVASYTGAYEDDEPISEDERRLSAEVRQVVHEVVIRIGNEGTVDLGDFTQYANDELDDADDQAAHRLDDAAHQDELEREHAEQHDE